MRRSEPGKLHSGLIALLLLTGCSDPTTAPASNLPTTPMQIGSKTYQLEIAGDFDSREHGLMERDALPADHGMIFVFEEPKEQTFWMHHTRFPLDIIYLDERRRIVSIHTMKAYDEGVTPSNGASKYAIEIGAGQAASTGAKPGDRLSVPDVVDKSLKN